MSLQILVVVGTCSAAAHKQHTAEKQNADRCQLERSGVELRLEGEVCVGIMPGLCSLLRPACCQQIALQARRLLRLSLDASNAGSGAATQAQMKQQALLLPPAVCSCTDNSSTHCSLVCSVVTAHRNSQTRLACAPCLLAAFERAAGASAGWLSALGRSCTPLHQPACTVFMLQVGSRESTE